MATYRFNAPQTLHKERFDKVVHQLLNEQVGGGVSKAMARKLVMAGAAYLAGSRCRIASKPVWAGTEVRVEYDAERVKKIDRAPVILNKDCILYERNGLLVVNKPAGLPTVATLDDARHNLIAALQVLLGERTDGLRVQRSPGTSQGQDAPESPARRTRSSPATLYLGERTDGLRVQRSPGTSQGQDAPESPARRTRSLPATMYLGIHHRLDAQTSGCILFTTDPARNGFVSQLFQEHLVKKEYLAVVHVSAKAPPKVWEVRDQLVRAEKKKNRYASTRRLGKPDSEGSFAYSRFELLEQRGDLALIRCVPVTGRTHQLRVHLSEYGLPIVGDRLYPGIGGAGLRAGTDAIGASRGTGAAAPGGRLMLHAYRLAFREEDGSEVSVEAPLPEEFKRLFALKSL